MADEIWCCCVYISGKHGAERFVLKVFCNKSERLLIFLVNLKNFWYSSVLYLHPTLMNALCWVKNSNCGSIHSCTGCNMPVMTNRDCDDMLAFLWYHHSSFTWLLESEELAKTNLNFKENILMMIRIYRDCTCVKNSMAIDPLLLQNSSWCYFI